MIIENNTHLSTNVTVILIPTPYYFLPLSVVVFGMDAIAITTKQ